MKNKIVLLAVLISSPVFSADCIVDEVMATSLQVVNQKSQAAVTALIEDRNLEEESCMPVLRQLGAGISSTIPSFGNVASGLGTKIRNMACGAANDAVKRVAGNMTATWEAPFGLGNVSAGANTTGDVGTQVKENDALNQFITKQVLGVSKQATNSTIGSVEQGIKQSTSGVTGVNREAANEVNSNFNEAKSNVLDNI